MALSIQRQWNAQIAYALQAGGLGDITTGTGIVLPLNTGHGEMTMDAIPSLQIRGDGLTVRGRHGTQKTKGAYKSELQAGNFDSIFEAIMRGTWAPGGSLGGSILINPTAGNLVRRYFTVEEFERDLTQSERYSNCVWSMMTLSMKPNQMIQCDLDWVGTGEVDGLVTPVAPSFTTADLVLPTATPMAALNATVEFSDLGIVLDLLDWTLKLDLKTTAPPVAASRFSPDVFDGVLQVSGSVKVMRRDLVPFVDAIDETVVTMSMLAQTPDAAQQLKFTIPQFTFQQAVKSDFKRDGGPLEVTIPFPEALVGVDDGTNISGSPTMVVIERNT